MPTVLALDVSLSMSRPVQGETNAEEYSRKNLAIHGLSSLLDQFSKLEFTSLVSKIQKQLDIQYTNKHESCRNFFLTITILLQV